MSSPFKIRMDTPLGRYFSAVWRLLRFDRPIGIWLLLWPTLWGLWLAADGAPPLKILMIFVTGVVLMRAAGCAINDYADRDFDPHVARTCNRPLATGELAPRHALGWATLLAAISLILVLFTNALTIAYAAVAAVLAATYPWAKRFHSFPQVHLGIAFAWAIPMGWTAIHGTHPGPDVWLLFTITIVWIVVYDTFYAMTDRDDDRKIGVKSSAIAFGEHDRLITGLLQAMFIAGLVMLGLRLEYGITWFIGVALAGLLSFHQQVLIVSRVPADCLRAFRNNHWLGLIVFSALVIDRFLADFGKSVG